jgi:hypothetical protein
MTQQLTPKTAKEIFNDMRVGKCSNAQAEAAAERRGILAEYKAEYRAYGEQVRKKYAASADGKDDADHASFNPRARRGRD